MPKITAKKLTDAGIARLPAAPKGQRTEHPDALSPGLILRVGDAGSKLWQCRFRVAGRQQKISLGAWPGLSLSEARAAAREARELAAQGIDPRKARQADEADPLTVGELIRAYITRETPRLANGAELESLARRELLPVIGKTVVEDFARRDAVRLLDKVMDRGQHAKARRLHWLLGRIFRWSLARGEIDANPLEGLPAPCPPKPRDRVLADDEIRVLWQAWQRQGWPWGHFGRLLLLTAARRNEVAELMWSELDDPPTRWHLPGARTKTGSERILPLSAAARAVVAEIPRWAEGGPFVITTTQGARPVSGFSRAKAATDRIAAEVAAELGIDPLPSWGFHDLRRTARTLLARIGVQDEVAERCIGHVGGTQLLRTYNRHKYEQEMADAFERLGREILRIVEGREEAAAVISIAGSGRATIG